MAGAHLAGGPFFGRPATRSGFDYPYSVLGLPDGGFVFDANADNRVERVDARGVLQPFAGNGRLGSSGDGGPATRARIWDASDLALRADGSVAIADFIGASVRVVTPDGRIDRLASFGVANSLPSLAGLADNGVLVAFPDRDRVIRIAPNGQRTPFWIAPDSDLTPLAVAASPDGTVFMAISGVPPALVAVDPGGAMRTVVSPFFVGPQLAVAPDGSLLAALGDAGPLRTHRGGPFVWPDPVVMRITPDGSGRVVAGAPEQAQGFDGDGEDPVGVDLGARDVSVAADGGLLIAGYDGVRYIAPARPGLLAAAITRPTLTSPRRPRISFALTMPATVTARVLHHGTVVAKKTQPAAAGDGQIELQRRLAPGSYVVALTARDADGRMTTDRQVLSLGGRLEAWAARQAATQVLEEKKFRNGAQLDPLRRCRRQSDRRFDCPNIQIGICQSVVAVLLRDDGLLYLRRYSGGLGKRCRLRRHPDWQGSAEPADPL